MTPATEPLLARTPLLASGHQDPLRASGEPVRWGVVSTGRIASTVTSDLALLPDAVRHAVSSRSRAGAEEFAARHGFRHAYAQRHADAGTRPDVLRELMDHRSLDVTMGYYKVSLSRKQEAVRTVAALAVDRHGAARGFGDPLAYEVESVGVPYGGCTEPSNVKAGGGHCRIRFQCAGCDFYRPDPSYLPALEQQIADLRADKEAALAMEAADWVVRNLDDQTRAYSKSADEMRRKLDALPAEERAAVESASRELRKARSAAAFIPLQALTTRSSE